MNRRVHRLERRAGRQVDDLQLRRQRDVLLLRVLFQHKAVGRALQQNDAVGSRVDKRHFELNRDDAGTRSRACSRRRRRRCCCCSCRTGGRRRCSCCVFDARHILNTERRVLRIGQERLQQSGRALQRAVELRTRNAIEKQRTQRFDKRI